MALPPWTAWGGRKALDGLGWPSTIGPEPPFARDEAFEPPLFTANRKP